MSARHTTPLAVGLCVLALVTHAVAIELHRARDRHLDAWRCGHLVRSRRVPRRLRLVPARRRADRDEEARQPDRVVVHRDRARPRLHRSRRRRTPTTRCSRARASFPWASGRDGRFRGSTRSSSSRSCCSCSSSRPATCRPPAGGRSRGCSHSGLQAPVSSLPSGPGRSSTRSPPTTLRPSRASTGYSTCSTSSRRFLFVPSALIIIGGVLVRSRRAQGVERLQFKWFAAASGLLVLSFLSFFLIPLGLPDTWAEGFVGIAFAAIAVSVGVAVLRYRLYDIDRVISRVLVYGCADRRARRVVRRSRAGRPAAVLVLRRRLGSRDRGLDARRRCPVPPRSSAGAADGRPAVLPPPLRHPADARDVRRRLRAQVELEHLEVELEGVVRETMQPTRVALWRLGGDR